MVKIPEQALEVVKAISQPRAQFESAAATAKDTIVGSKVVKDEIARTLKGYVDMAISGGSTVLRAPRALWKFVSGHPLESAGEIMSGIADAGRTFGKGVDITSSVTRIPWAVAARGKDAAIEGLKLPFKGIGALAKSPIYAWNLGDRLTTAIYAKGGNISNAISKGIDNLGATGKATAAA